MEKVVQEVTESEKCRKNVVIYGACETCQATSKEDQEKLDSTLVNNLLIFLGVQGNTVSTIRLGKYDPSRENPKRPIKIKLSHENACRNFNNSSFVSRYCYFL